MKRMFVIGTAAAVLVASGAFAATVIGGSSDADRGPTDKVALDVKRVSAQQAATAGAVVSAKKKKPKIIYFTGATVDVPADGFTLVLQLSCGAGQKVLGGLWTTNRGIYADINDQVDKAGARVLFRHGAARADGGRARARPGALRHLERNGAGPSDALDGDRQAPPSP
jgi:hypothetical protein